MTNADRLVNLELSRFFKHLMHARLLAAPIVMTVGVLFISYGQTWRGVVCLALSIPVFVMAVWDRLTLGTEPVSSSRMF